MAAQLNPASRRWYYRRTVTAEIDCDGARHRIAWRRGKLVLEDHDVLAERSLRALGAKPPMCLELLDAWRARRDSELLPGLLLGDRTVSPQELALRRERHDAEMESAQRMPERVRAYVASQPGRAAMVSVVERQAVERLELQRRMWVDTLMAVLPLELRRALALSAVVHIERRWHDDEYRRRHARHIEPVLTAVATPVFELSARRWRRNLELHRRLAARTRLLSPGEEPTCAVWADRRRIHAALALPLSWFTEVWGRGIALVDGCFVMGVVDGATDGKELRVHAIRPEREDWATARALESPALVTRRGGGPWRLRWM